MSEFAPISGIERNFTIGKVEKSVEQKIQDTSKKIIDSGVLNSQHTAEERKTSANEIVASIGFESYEQLVNVSRGQNYTEIQKDKAQEAFDILKKSVSLAMNASGDQELQTRLYTGGVRDVLPESWKYGEDNSKFNLTSGVTESTITSQEIQNSLRTLEADKKYRRANLEIKSDRETKAEIIENKTIELMDMDVPADKENELFSVRAYLNTQAAILRGEFNVKDGSADKPDVAAVLGKAAEKIAEAAEKMTEAADKMTSNESTPLDKGIDSFNRSIVDFSEAVENMSDYNRKFESFYKQKRQSSNEYDSTGETEEQYKARTGETLIRKDDSFPYSKDYSYQVAWVEERLQHIEHYQTENIKRELALGHYYTYPLFDVLAQGRAPQEILDMIEGRLNLKAIGDAIAKNSGTMGSRQEFINVINTLENEGFDLSPEIITSFFENEIASGVGGGKYGNLRTAEAWNLMEMANFGYETMLNWAYKDGSSEIKKAIDEYNRIGGSGLGGFFKMKGIVSNDSLDDTRFKGIKRNYFLDKSGKEGKTIEFTTDDEGKRVKERRKARADILRNYMIEKITREISIDYKLGKLTDEERKSVNKKKDYTKIIFYEEAIEGLDPNEVNEIKKIAKVSMEVSESMFSATGENSVVNWDFIAGDEVAEVFNIQLLRILDGPRNKKGKAAGPQASLSSILTLSPGFVRQFSDSYNPNRAIYIGENKFLEEIVAAKEIKELIKNGYSSEGDRFIDSQQKISYDKLNNKALWAAYWFSIWGKKLWPAREEILDSTLPAKKDLLDETYYQGKIDHFNKVDGQIGTYGEVQAAWLAGKVQGALYRMLSEWTENDYTMLKGMVTEKYFSTENGVKLTFVTKEQWEWIEKLTDMKRKIFGDKAVNLLGSAMTPGSGKRK